MKTFTKAVAGTVAASAMALSAMSPAMAQDRRHHDGVRTGEVIAGALIVGGIVALASQNNNNHRRGFAAVSPRQAVDQCVRAAERGASRMRGDVTDVRSVRQTRQGYEVRGRIAVKTFAGNNWRGNGQYGNGQRGNGQYGNGWGNDFRGLNSNLRGFDGGTFVCSFERGRAHVDYNGIRGL